MLLQACAYIVFRILKQQDCRSGFDPRSKKQIQNRTDLDSQLLNFSLMTVRPLMIPYTCKNVKSRETTPIWKALYKFQEMYVYKCYQILKYIYLKKKMNKT